MVAGLGYKAKEAKEKKEEEAHAQRPRTLLEKREQVKHHNRESFLAIGLWLSSGGLKQIALPTK